MIQHATGRIIKMAVLIETVDIANRNIQCRFKDGGVGYVSVIGVPNTFIWPQEGEHWFVHKDGHHWKLDSKIDVKNDYQINEMQPGEARIASDTIKDASGKSVLATFDSSADSYSVLQHQDLNTITNVKLNDAGTILTFTTKDVNHLIAGQQVTISGFKPDSYNGKFTVLGSGASAKLAVAIPAITVSVAAVNADASTVTFSSNTLLQSSTTYKIHCNNISGNVTFTTPSTLGSTITFALVKGSGSIVTTTTTVDSNAIIVPVFSTITLDSVENWPTSGSVTIDSEIFSYSGLKVAPDNQLTGISKASDNKTISAIHAVGAMVQAPNTSDKPNANTFKIISSNTDAVETYGQIENQWVPSSDMKVNSVTVPDNGSITVGNASKLKFGKAGYIRFDDSDTQYISINQTTGVIHVNKSSTNYTVIDGNDYTAYGTYTSPTVYDPVNITMTHGNINLSGTGAQTGRLTITDKDSNLPSVILTADGNIRTSTSQSTSSTIKITKWIDKWKASTSYVVGNFVYYSSKIYQCKTNHTSGSTFIVTNWNVIQESLSSDDFTANPVSANQIVLDSNGNINAKGSIIASGGTPSDIYTTKADGTTPKVRLGGGDAGGIQTNNGNIEAGTGDISGRDVSGRDVSSSRNIGAEGYVRATDFLYAGAAGSTPKVTINGSNGDASFNGDLTVVGAGTTRDNVISNSGNVRVGEELYVNGNAYAGLDGGVATSANLLTTKSYVDEIVNISTLTGGDTGWRSIVYKDHIDNINMTYYDLTASSATVTVNVGTQEQYIITLPTGLTNTNVNWSLNFTFGNFTNNGLSGKLNATLERGDTARQLYVYVTNLSTSNIIYSGYYRIWGTKF